MLPFAWGVGDLHILALEDTPETRLRQFKGRSVLKKTHKTCWQITPLHLAAINPHPHVFKTLRSMTAAEDDFHGRGVAHYAAACTVPDNLATLQAAGEQLDRKDKFRQTPLHVAAKAGRAANVALLLAAIADREAAQTGAWHDSSSDEPKRKMPVKKAPSAVEAACTCKDRAGHTAISYAARFGHANALEAMLRAGCPADVVDKERRTALHVAAQHGHLACIEVLLAHGATLEAADKRGYVLHVRIVLVLVCFHVLLCVCVRNLVTYSPHPTHHPPTPNRNVVQSILEISRYTALHHAAKNGQYEVTRFLLLAGHDTELRDTSGNLPAHFACAYAWVGVLQLLHMAGARLDVMNDWKMSLPGISVVKHSHACLKFLMDHAIGSQTLNQRDSKGMTVLHHACQNPTASSLSTVKSLLAKGVDPNIVDMRSETALHRLCQYSTPAASQRRAYETSTREPYKVEDSLLIEIATALVKAGADVNLGHCGETPLTAAMAGDHPGLASFFLCGAGGFTSHSSNNPNVLATLFSLGLKRDIQKLWATMIKKVPKGDVALALQTRDQHGQTPLHSVINTFVKQESSPSAPTSTMSTVNVEVGEVTSHDVVTARLKTLFTSCFKLGADINARIQIVPDASQQSKERPKSGYDEKTKKYTRQPEFDVEFGGSTLLHIACRNAACSELVEMLLMAGADPNIADGDGETPLFTALASSPHSESVACLLGHGAKADARSCCSGDSTVIAAILGNTIPDSLKLLLDGGGDPNQPNWIGMTPLLSVVGQSYQGDQLQREVRAKLLLEYGADPSAADGEGASPLHRSLMTSKNNINSSFAVEQLLVAHGANLHAVDKQGRSLLHMAFVDVGAPAPRGEQEDITQQQRGRGFQRQQQQTEVSADPIEIVSDMCALDGLLVDHVDRFGWSPLHYAARAGAMISTRYLLQRGADLNREDGAGNTALQLALLGRHVSYSVTLITDAVDASRDVAVVNLQTEEIAYVQIFVCPHYGMCLCYLVMHCS